MQFGTFMIWNVAGAVAWASLIGLLSYYLGAAVVKAVQRDVGIGIAVIAGSSSCSSGFHLLRRRMEA